MRIDIVTIFPDYFGPVGEDGRVGGSGPLGVSLIGKAGARGDIDFRVHDLRSWTTDVHHTVDDTPFGGGPGMVMKPDVWGDALDAVLADTGLRRHGASRHGPGQRGRNRAPDCADAERDALYPGVGGRLRAGGASRVRLRAV